MALVVVFQQLLGYRVEGLCYGASQIARRPLASRFHEKSRAEVEHQRGRDIAALLVDVRGIEGLGVCRRADGNGRCWRGIGPGRTALAAAGRQVGARDRAGGDDGRWRDGQPAAVVELEYQALGADREDSRLSHPALCALQCYFVLRASLQVKTRGHDPSA